MVGGGHAGVTVAQAINVQLVFAMLGQSAYTKIVVGRSGDVREVGGDAGGVPHDQIVRGCSAPGHEYGVVGEVVHHQVLGGVAGVGHNGDVVNHQRGIVAGVTVVEPHDAQAVVAGLGYVDGHNTVLGC